MAIKIETANTLLVITTDHFQAHLAKMSFTPIYQPYEILGYTVRLLTNDVLTDQDLMIGRFLMAPVYTVETYEKAWEKAAQMAKENIPAYGEALTYLHTDPLKAVIGSPDKAVQQTHDFNKNSLAAGGCVEIWTRSNAFGGQLGAHASVYIVPVLGKERVA